MRSYPRRLLALLALAIGFTGSCCVAFAATPAAAAALRKLDDTSVAGIRKRDVKFVDAVYAPDVVMFPAYGQFKVEGLDLTRDAWKSLYDTFATITRCEWSERR